jgi:hypothetical protein
VRPAKKVTATKLRIPGNEIAEGLDLRSMSGCGRDRPGPASREILIELFRDSVVIATSSRSLDEALLGFSRAIPPVQDPSHTNVIDMAYAGAAQFLTFPPIRQLVIA